MNDNEEENESETESVTPEDQIKAVEKYEFEKWVEQIQGFVFITEVENKFPLKDNILRLTSVND